MKTTLLFSALVLIAAVSSCKKEVKTGSSAASRLSVKITDAPGAYQSLFLNIKEIQVITSEGTTTLPVAVKNLDILKFRMGKDTLLASEDIPAGHIEEVRLVLEDTGNQVVIDGKPYELLTPSAQSSGTKLKMQADLVEGVGYTLLLDFDAARSVVRTGNGKYLLKPVIRAVPEAVSGALTGKISPAASNPQVYAINGTDTIGTFSDSIGNFYFKGLKEGKYKVNVVPSSSYQAKSIDDVTVTNGALTDLGTVELSAVTADIQVTVGN